MTGLAWRRTTAVSSAVDRRLATAGEVSQDQLFPTVRPEGASSRRLRPGGASSCRLCDLEEPAAADCDLGKPAAADCDLEGSDTPSATADDGRAAVTAARSQRGQVQLIRLYKLVT